MAPPVFIGRYRLCKRRRVVRSMSLSYTQFHEEKRSGAVCALVGGVGAVARGADDRRVSAARMAEAHRKKESPAGGTT